MNDRTVYVTDRKGNDAKIVGSEPVVDLICEALERAGARWDDTVLCYDFGFYQDSGETGS